MPRRPLTRVFSAVARAFRPERMAALVLLCAPAWLFVFHLVTVNAALKSGVLVSAINAATPDLRFTMGDAWTVRPGRLHVRDVTVRFEDRNVQFYLLVPRAEVDLDVLALRKQTFHLSRVRADGVAFFFRHRVVNLDDRVTTRRIASYPRIPGFAPVPVYAIGPPKPPITDAQYNLWTVALDDVDALANELWFLEYRYRGPSRAMGNFRLKPVRSVAVAASLDLQGGALTIEPSALADAVRGRVTVDVPSFDVNEPKGIDVLKKVNARLDVSVHLKALPMAVYDGPSIDVGREGAQLDIAIGTRGGVLERESLVHFSGGIAYATTGLVLEGPLSARMFVPDLGKTDLTADLSVARATIGEERAARGGEIRRKTTTTAALRDVSVRASFAHHDVSADPKFLGGSARVSSADLPDLAFLGSPIARGGRLHGSLSAVMAADRSVRSDVKASVTDLELVFSDVLVHGAGSLSGQYVSRSPTGGGALEDAKLEIPALAVDLPRVGRRTTWVTLTTKRLAWQGVTPHTLDGYVHVVGGNGGVLSGFAEKKGGIGAFAAKSFLDDNAFQANVRVAHLPWTTRIELSEASCGSILAEGGLVAKGDEIWGAFLLSVAGANVGAELSPTHVTLLPFRTHSWLERQLRIVDVRD